jgi:hypothetical protein
MLRTVPLVVLLVSLISCSSSQREISVEVRIPNPNGVSTPIAGTLVVALPYDRDSILQALESRAPEARPHTQALDSLFQAFQGPFRVFAQLAWRQDRLRRTRDSLAAAGADPAGLDDSLARLAPELERARLLLDSARRSTWTRMETLRADVRRWEQATYTGYDTMVLTLARDRMREGIADTTDALGRASFRLGRGSWWIHARSPDPDDPNAEWYWNLPVREVDSVLLSPATGRRRPRYGS